MTDYSNDKPWMPPPVVLNLLIINTIVFLATIWLERMGYYNITNMLALNSIATGRFGIWQLVTYMFMHASFGHLFFNMFALYMFVIELIEGITVADGVAHFAHLGGMLFGLILILYWRKHPFSRF